MTILSAKSSAIRLLHRWLSSSEKDWTQLSEDRGFYGSGFNHWGVQTNQKYLAACAVIGTEFSVSEEERQWAIDRAKAALRFNLASHRSGPHLCSDGTQWGHSWISALGTERMMHGVHRLLPFLNDEDSMALRRMLISEAEWLLHDYRRGNHVGIQATRWAREGGNDPESNLWNGGLLWRTASLYPDHPHADDWRERAHAFLINSVSIESDALNETLVAGKPIRERHIGPNFFPGYALDHHGYFNLGYMVICTSQAAMLHFDSRFAGFAPPESLYHHQADLWAVLRRLIFGDARLARVGGDTRVRYAYCQEYLLPSLLFAADQFQDAHALELIEKQIQLIEIEAEHSGDGLFYSRRLADLRRCSPYYYTRLESDRAAALGMWIANQPLAQIPKASATSFEKSVQGSWTEPEYQAAFHRSPTRLASFVWNAYGHMQGMCQPPSDGHLTEWQYHLGGIVEFLHHPKAATPPESIHHRQLRHATVREFPGGFAAWGAVNEGINLSLQEGWSGSDSAIHQMLFVALPDDHTVVGLQHCRTGPFHRYVSRVRGLQFNLLNDFYNDSQRKISGDFGEMQLTAPAKEGEVRAIPGNWLNLEGKIGLVGLYGSESFSILRQPEAADGVLPSMHVEQIGFPIHDEVRLIPPHTTVLDAGWMVVSSIDSTRTQQLSTLHSVLHDSTLSSNVRTVEITDQKGERYWIAANFSEAEASTQAPSGFDLLTSKTCLEGDLSVPAGNVALRRLN